MAVRIFMADVWYAGTPVGASGAMAVSVGYGGCSITLSFAESGHPI